MCLVYTIFLHLAICIPLQFLGTRELLLATAIPDPQGCVLLVDLGKADYEVTAPDYFPRDIVLFLS